MVKRSILVVEDEEDIRELVSYTLLKEGYQVASVASGEEALSIAEAKPPDLIVLDLMLPGLDGVTVCQRLRANPKTAGTGDRDADRQGRGGGHRRRAQHGCRRLHHQAVQPQRAACANPRRAAQHRPSPGRRRGTRGRRRLDPDPQHGDPPGTPRGLGGRRVGRVERHRVPPASLPGANPAGSFRASRSSTRCMATTMRSPRARSTCRSSVSAGDSVRQAGTSKRSAASGTVSRDD